MGTSEFLKLGISFPIEIPLSMGVPAEMVYIAESPVYKSI